MAKAKLTYRPYSRESGSWSYAIEAATSRGVRVVFTDNTGGTSTEIPANLFKQAEEDVFVARRIENAGHVLARGYLEED